MARLGRRVGRTLGISLALSIMTAAAAFAFGWGTLTVNFNGYQAGAGYGTVTSECCDVMKLLPNLSDKRTDGVRTYAQADTSGNFPGKVQSDRRADGGIAFANMANKIVHLGGNGSGQGTTVKVCMDWSGHFDPCSSSDFGYLP